MLNAIIVLSDMTIAHTPMGFLLLLTNNFTYKEEGFMNKKIKTLFCRKRVLFLRKIKAEKAVL